MFQFNSNDVIQIEKKYDYSLLNIIDSSSLESVTLYCIAKELYYKYNIYNDESEIEEYNLIEVNIELIKYLIAEGFFGNSNKDNNNNTDNNEDTVEEENNKEESVIYKENGEYKYWGEIYLRKIGNLVSKELSISDMLSLTPKELDIIIDCYSKVKKSETVLEVNRSLKLAYDTATFTAVACFDNENMPKLDDILIKNNVDEEESINKDDFTDDIALASLLSSI